MMLEEAEMETEALPKMASLSQLPETELTEVSQLPPEDVGESMPKCCCKCCHCKAMRQALRHAEFLQSAEGRRRQCMKLAAKSFFMDLMSLSRVRKEIQESLQSDTDPHPSRHHSFPVSICEAQQVTETMLELTWWVHDLSDIDRYEIAVDGVLSKVVYDPLLTTTMLTDVDATQQHVIHMKAVTRRSANRAKRKLDDLVKELCAASMQPNAIKEILCRASEPPMNAAKRKYFRINCKSLADRWRISEFLYTPEDNDSDAAVPKQQHACGCNNL